MRGELVRGAERVEDGVVLEPPLAREQRRRARVPRPRVDAHRVVLRGLGLQLDRLLARFVVA